MTPGAGLRLVGIATLVLACTGGNASAQKPVPAYKKTIHWKARIGDLAAVKAMLDAKPALLNARDSDRRTPLHLAARWGRVEIVDLLIERGAKIDVEAYNRFTPLYLAASFGRERVVRRLIRANAKLEGKTAFGQRALQVAAKNGHKKIVQLLFYAGAEYDAATAIHLDDRKRLAELLARRAKSTATHENLVVAVRGGKLAAVEMLLAAKAPLRGKYFGPGIVPITYFALRHPKVLAKLIDAGVDPKGSFSGTFLHGTLLEAAARERHEKSALLLLERGVRPSPLALDLAVREGLQTLFDALLTKGIKPSPKTMRTLVDSRAQAVTLVREKRLRVEENLGKVAARLVRAGVPRQLDFVVAFGTVDELEVELGKPKADNRAAQLARATWVALRMQRSDRLDLLIKAGVKASLADDAQRSLLWWAAWYGDAESIRVLLAHGADVARPNKTGDTPLHAAARAKRASSIEALKKAGAKLTAKNRKGLTPYALANILGATPPLLALLEIKSR